MPIYSQETSDFIGTATYSDGRYPVRAAMPNGRYRSFSYQRDAVNWLNTQYNRTH